MGDAALLLAGYGTDRRRLHPLRDALRAAGVDATVWPYHPAGTLDRLAAELAREAGRTDADRVHLVGHSFGGLLCAAATLADPSSVASITCINTPWRGTWVSYTGSGPLVDGMRWRSEELRRTRSAIAEHLREPDGPRWLLVSAAGDLAVTAASALRIGAGGARLRRRSVAASGHSVSLLAPRLIAVVTDHVADGHDGTRAPTSRDPGRDA